MRAYTLLAALAVSGCWSDSVQPYCPAAEAAVGFICGGILPVVLGSGEAGDFDGVTTVQDYNTLYLQRVGDDGEARMICLGEGCPSE